MTGKQTIGAAWPVVAAAAAGLSVSIAPLLLYTHGVLMAPLADVYGWSRTELAGAITALQLSTAVSAPLFGGLIDRWGAPRIVVLSCVVLGASVTALPALLTQDAASLWLMYAIIPLIAGGASPIGFARLVVDRFDAGRGLALGLALAGVGVGAAAAPPIVQLAVDAWGPAGAYRSLGAAALAVAALLAVSLHRSGRPNAGPARPAGPGGWRDILTPGFAGLCVLFAVLGAITVGIVAHLSPILQERQLSPGAAAGSAGLAGLAVIAGRPLVGWALDRAPARLVTIAIFLVLALCLVLLLLPGGPAPGVFGSILLGLAVGAEVDVLAYVVSRAFPPSVFGRTYGAAFALFVLGSAAGPLLVAGAADHSGSYRAGLAVMLVVALAAACATPGLLRPLAASSGSPRTDMH